MDELAAQIWHGQSSEAFDGDVNRNNIQLSHRQPVRLVRTVKMQVGIHERYAWSAAWPLCDVLGLCADGLASKSRVPFHEDKPESICDMLKIDTHIQKALLKQRKPDDIGDDRNAKRL
jgi:hypothetical protein